ncbi:pentapeptide repeat-containing protein [Mycoavidus sp. SF9855]|uniref:WD40 repeat domain-containing protein n=1 Tax=Mycoavidus sp. SF9855 TaxID=2968475 RepID=UPI00211BB936|nr:pentapeptide repeat-containing protein [Mycoavidus sp. SF9855]UUM21289.1 pentapeptide repeat-containing protein [Mycoavidus sp. SF9855]
MLTPISSAATQSYSVVQKATAPSLLSLPVEIREEVESHLQPVDQQNLFKALTTVTRNGEPLDSPALKLHLIKDRIKVKYQEALINSDESMKTLAWNEFVRLWNLDQLDQIVEKSALFELLRFVNDPEIFKYLYEEIQNNSGLEQKLLSWVERSKTEEVHAVAANALTLLVKAGVQLNNRDFSGIRVPGADLSYGVFDDTQFQGADLRNVKWYRARLAGVNLERADLKGLRLGERPALQMENEVKACSYSLDGRWLAVTESKYIYLYETENLQKVHTYTSHEDPVHSITFSRDGQWLAVGDGQRVNLWHVLGDRSLAHTYIGYGDVAFSADDQYLAFGSKSNYSSVEQWHVSGNRSLAHTYTVGAREIGPGRVVFSSDGRWLAADDTRMVFLWYVLGDRSPAQMYSGSPDWAGSAAFSVDGQYLAFGSNDSVELWHVSGDPSLAHTYTGHDMGVNSVAFSNDGQWLASVDWGHTVRLWHVSGNRSLACTYTEHKSWVNSIAFSSDSQWLASASDDKTVRLRHISDDPSPAHGYIEEEVEQGMLTAEGALIENAYNLSPQNAELLRQRGAR